MSYSDITDISELIGESELIRLTGSDPPDESKILAAIGFADSLINAYTYGRVTIPTVEVPPLINKISADLAIVLLSENYYRFNELPNTLLRLKIQSFKLLEDIAMGKISIGDRQNIFKITNMITEKNHDK
ncbi:MAG: DUF1320 domain-containing protein [Candidatus Kapabacteria bacterium]|nr:DUF1320 domain-containing protein [Ignavibacteriota bacterium]MCW5885037.1 DUF1320 domain-containing protein [Candidatus Kapabacteria bacterium]